MKKILLALSAVAALASADGFTVGANGGYASATTDATNGTTTASADSKAYTYGLSVGYEVDVARFGAYINKSAIKDDLDSKSRGVYADYLIPFQDKYKVFIGGTYGIGEQDLSTTQLDFSDFGVRTGILIDLNVLELEIGVRQNWRTYDNVVVGTTTITSDSKILGTYAGLNYKF